MIDYEPFWRTLKKKNLSTYYLTNTSKISNSVFDKLRHNRAITTTTLNDLCRALQCNVEDVIRYVESENDQLL